MIRLGLAEDNLFTLRALEEKLSFFDDIQVVFTASNGAMAVDQAGLYKVDVILMDIEMPVLSGIEATRRIAHEHPDVRIIIITVFDDDQNILEAIKAGADSYILKDVTPDKLRESIADTLAGGAVMSPTIAAKAMKLLRQPIESPDAQVMLSERETEILELLSQGLSNRLIAERLFISPFTVKRHVENIYQKLQARNRIEMLQKARQNRLL